MKKFIAGIAAGSFVIATIAPALAATPVAEVSGLHGKVLVNHGKGFEPAIGSMLLNAGDKIMVGANSSAKINYLNSKCLVSANASSVVSVTAAAPCKLGTVVGSVDNVFAIPASAPATGGQLSDDTTPLLIVGGLVALGGGLALLGVFNPCKNSVSSC